MATYFYIAITTYNHSGYPLFRQLSRGILISGLKQFIQRTTFVLKLQFLPRIKQFMQHNHLSQKDLDELNEFMSLIYEDREYDEEFFEEYDEQEK